MVHGTVPCCSLPMSWEPLLYIDRNIVSIEVILRKYQVFLMTVNNFFFFRKQITVHV